MKALALGLLILAFGILETLIGGTRLLFVLPGLEIIALAGMLTLWPTFRHNRNFSSAAFCSAILFIGYILVRNRLSPFDYIGRMQLLIGAGCLLTYLLGVLVLDKPKERRWLFLALLLMALLQVAYGFIQFKQGHQSIPLPWAARRDDWWRASGFYISPNHFAGYLELVALMAFSFIFWGRLGVVAKILWAYVGVSCVAGIAMSGSRGGYLSFSFGALVLLGLSLACYHKLAPRRFLVVALISIGGAALLFGSAISLMLMNTGVRERLVTVNDPSNVRLQLWDAALQQFQLSPLTGTGAATYVYYGRLFRDPRVQNDPIHVHNDYLQLLSEYGILAAALFLLVYGTHVFSGFRGLLQLVNRTFDSGDTQSDGLALCLGALSGLAAFTVHSIVDFNMHIPANAFLMAFLFAILASPASMSESIGRFSPLLGGIGRWLILPGGSLAILFYGLPLLPGEWHAEQARRAVRDYQLETALDEAKKGLKFEISNPDLYYYAGEAAREMADQNPENAVHLRLQSATYFTAGLKVFPPDSRLAVKLGQTYGEMKRYDEALQALAFAEEWDPNSSYPYAYRGLVEMNQGFFSDAADYFRSALNLEPGNPIAREGLKRSEEILRKIRGKDAVPQPADAEASPDAENDDETERAPLIDLRSLGR